MDGPSVSLGSKLSNAKVSFAIFKRDIKRLLVNPVALVVTLGVCVIPSLYAWYNIVANWDPYGNTQGIKIAIANNDRGTQNDLVGELNAGDKVVDQLKENHQLGWTFVDSTADAKEGVESGEYYAAIVIPKNFSDNLVSMLDGNYHQPKLTYYVNEKKSAIAPKVTDTGANTIEEQINSEFVSTVGKTVAGIAKDAGVDLKDKATQTQDSLASSVSEASDTLGEVRDSIGDMNAAIDKTSGAIASADAALAGLQGQAPSLTQAISQGNDLLSEARTTAGNSITSLSKALSEGSLALTKTSASANAAIGKLTGAVTSTTTRIDNSLESLQATIDHNKAVIGHLEILANDTSTGSEEIDARIVSTIDLLREQNEKLQSIKDGLSAQSSAMANDAAAVSGASDAINNAIHTGATNLGQAQTDLGQNALPKASSALDSFAAVSGDLTGIVSGMTPTLANARGTLAQLSATLGQAKTTLSQTDSSLAKVQDKKDALYARLDDLADALGCNRDEAIDLIDKVSKIDTDNDDIHPVNTIDNGAGAIAQTEKYAVYQLQYDRGDRNGEETISVCGISSDSRYWKDLNVGDGRVVFGGGLLDKFGWSEGQKVTLGDKYEGEHYSLEYAGKDCAWGSKSDMNIYMSIEDFNELFDNDAAYFNGYVSDEKLDLDAHYFAGDTTPDDMRAVGDQFIGMMSKMIGMMVGLAVFIFLLFMYLLTKAVIDHSARSISYMKVFGYRDSEISHLYIRSITLCVAASLVLSLPVIIGSLTAIFRSMLLAYNGNIEIYVPAWSMAACVGIGFATYLVVALLHTRSIRRVSLAEALKVQE